MVDSLFSTYKVLGGAHAFCDESRLSKFNPIWVQTLVPASPVACLSCSSAFPF